MKSLIYYLLQMIVVSGLLYGYYHFVLRNNKFHRYNRFYLLAAVVMSLLIPFLHIPVYFESDKPLPIIQTLNVITYSPAETSISAPVVFSSEKSKEFNWQILAWAFYIAISCIVLLKIIFSIRKIRAIIRHNEVQKLDNINFVNTNEDDAPFSFFRWLFWNREIELRSEKGEQIFRHELFHIQQKHSWDVLFMELLTAIFWINPFYHLIKKEVRVIHEFLADEFAVTAQEKWQFAEFLLMKAFQTKNYLINPFFSNQIKRRIAMITLSKKPGPQYLRKILVLPIAAVIFLLFAFNYKPRQKESMIVITGDVKELPDGKIYLADAYYWMTPIDSAIIKNGHFEFKITPDPNFYPSHMTIVYPDEQAVFAKLGGFQFENNRSSAFYLEKGVTEIHDNGKPIYHTPGGGSMLEVNVTAGKQNDVYAKYVRVDFSLTNQGEKRKQELEYYRTLIKQYSYSYYFLQSVYENRGQYSTRELRELLSLFDVDVQNSRLGKMLVDYITNGPKANDQLKIISDTSNPKSYFYFDEETMQFTGFYRGQKIKQVLFYFQTNPLTIILVNNEKINLSKKEAEDIGFPYSELKEPFKLNDKGYKIFVVTNQKNETIAVAYKKEPKSIFHFNGSKKTDQQKWESIYGLIPPPPPPPPSSSKINIPNKFQDALIIVDGKEMNSKALESIDVNSIKSINVLKGDTATKKYGEKGKNGAVEITTRGEIHYKEELDMENLKNSDDPISQDEARKLLQRVFASLKNSDVESFVRLWYLDNTLGFDKKIFDRQQVIEEFSDLKNFMTVPVVRNTPVRRITIEPMPPFFKARYKIKAYYRIDDTLSLAYGFLVDYIDGEWKFRWHGETTIAPHSDLDEKLEKTNPVLTKVEVEASFPGGNYAWNKFLADNLDARVPVINKVPNGKYTVWVKFIVDEDGSVSDIKALTKNGFGMEEEVLRVLKLSPNWNPAMQNGKKVKTDRTQPITFVIGRTNENINLNGPPNNTDGKMLKEIIVTAENNNSFNPASMNFDDPGFKTQ